MIHFACPTCQETYSVSDREAGTKFACNGCGQRVQVPTPFPHAAFPADPVQPPVSDHAPSRSQRASSLAKVALVICCTAVALTGVVLFLLSPAQQRHTPPGKDAEDTKDREPLAERAVALLKANCYRCHGENGSAEGGLNYILDRDKLIEREKIKPGNAEASRLFRRVQRGTMPPEDEKPRPTTFDIAVLKQWIQGGAPAAAAPVLRRTFVPDSDVVAKIHTDLMARPDRDRRFIRYFTFTHLYNAGLSEDELQTYRHGLSKLVNSLSWNREIVKPRPVDTARTAFAVDIRDFQWSDRVWKRVLSAYPYGVLLDIASARECHEIAGGQLSYVRADWFMATASRPPLYHEVLQLPDTERKLEEQLHIDIAENIRQEKAVRAGFNSSGVSRNNRLIERHASPYGAYWRSYDFADNVGRRNLFAHPLGPGRDNNMFEADGGEIIFDLPNGLHAFMLINSKGQRLDKAPNIIVSDPRRPDRAVENGLSCMTCHVRGLVSKPDQIRAHAKNNPSAFAAAELDTILALYPAGGAGSWFDKDNTRFRKAVEVAGARFATTESISTLVQHYERELDLTTAAAEVGLPPRAFADRLAGSPVLARTLGPLRISGGTVQREVFVGVFAQVVSELGMGTHLAP